MKVIKPYHQHFPKEGMTPYQFIEKIGRTCYKSEDKITDDSAVKFVKGLCNRKHFAMIEHYWVHMKYTGLHEDLMKGLDMFARCDCALMGESTDILRHVYITDVYDIYISAPLRVFFDMVTALSAYDLNTDPINHVVDEMLSCVGNYFPEIFPQCFSYRNTRHFQIMPEEDFCDDLYRQLADSPKGIREQEIMKHCTHTVLFVCDRGVTHELVRHRPCSFAQESTRYCNYSQGKFNNEITVILPFFFDTGMGTASNSTVYEAWKYSCEVAERKYLELIGYGATPQEARSVLPNSLKTEIIMTTNETEWQHIVNLRAKGTTGSPHPQMKEIMQPWYEELTELSEGRIK